MAAAAASSQSQVPSAGDARLAAELDAAALRSPQDPAAAARLQDLLLEIDERLATGDVLDELLLTVVCQRAALHPISALEPSERFLDEDACLQLAERAAQAARTPDVRAELTAQAALSIFLARRQTIDLDAAETKLRALAGATPPPTPATRVGLLLQVADLTRMRSDLTGTRAVLDEAVRILDDATRVLEDARTGLEVPLDARSRAIEEQVLLLADPRTRTELMLGQLELDLGRPDLAARHYRASRLTAQVAGGPTSRVQRINEARFWITVDDNEAVLDMCDELLDDSGMEASYLPSIHYRRGIACFQAAMEAGGPLDGAREELEVALASRADPAIACACRVRLGEIFIEAGDLDRAAMELAAARAASEAVGRVEAAVLAQLTYLEVRVERLRGSRSKKRLLDDCDALRATVEASMADFARLEPVFGGLGYLRYPHRVEPIVEWILAELENNDDGRGAERSIVPWIRSQMSGYLARRLSVREPTLADVRNALPTDGILLGYLPGQRETLLFVLEREGPVEVFSLEGRWTLNRRIDDQAMRLTTWRGEDAIGRRLEADAMELAADLVPPKVVGRMREGRRVVCVGTDLLGRLPFESLRLAGGQWLGGHVAIEHWPSIPVAVDLARRARAASATGHERAIGFLAPTSPRSELRPLALSVEECEALADTWSGLEVIRGNDATESSVSRLEEGGWRAALFLAHGLENPELPVPNGIALAAQEKHDGDLWAHEIRSLRAVPPLIVLGVCGAGFGAPRLGEDGANHLGGAWIERGARSIVLSGFGLERGVTVRTLATLGRGLSTGSSLPEAMRAARSTVAEGRPASIDPLLLQVVGWSP